MTAAEIIEHLMDLGWGMHVSSSIIDGKKMIELTYTHGTNRGSIMARGRGTTAVEAIGSMREDMTALLDILRRVEL